MVIGTTASARNVWKGGASRAIYAPDLCREWKGGGMDPTDGLGKCGGAAPLAVHHRALHVVRAAGVPLPLLTGALTRICRVSHNGEA
jgi:hypothetical protein